ncbi:MAG: formate dehydrogenase accessory sulfurtransferase FdhD [Nitrospinota bacterium]
MHHIFQYKAGQFSQRKLPVVQELPLRVVVNDEELATMLSTPVKLEYLVIGFLYFERVIASLRDIRSLEVDSEDATAYVELNIPFRGPSKRVLTSGCTGGITFHLDLSLYPPVNTQATIRPESLFPLMQQLYERTELYRTSRGIHAAALADPEEGVLFCAEDVGRHNALDKILGEALCRGVDTAGKVLLSTGRISSEMLRKGARMGVPFIVSRTSPTDLAIELAKRLGITLVGYLRHNSFNLYSHPLRMDYERPRQTAGVERGEDPIP